MRKRGRNFAGKHRPLDPTAALHAIGMNHGMSDDQLRDLGLAIHTSIERLRRGKPEDVDFHTLAAMVNVSLILCERGVGAEAERIVKDAQDALLRMLDRRRKIGVWAFGIGDFPALTAAADLHEQQIAIVLRIECRDAMLECRRRIERGQVLNQVTA